jgi:hypothetical protein
MKTIWRSEELVNAGSIPRGDLWIQKRPLLKIVKMSLRIMLIDFKLSLAQLLQLKNLKILTL